MNIIHNKPTKKPTIDVIQARYQFTDGEMRELSQKLARSTQEAQSVEATKKEVMSDFKAKLDRLSASSAEFAGKITTGYEMRETPCFVTFDAKQGKKFFHRRQVSEKDGVKVITAGEMVKEETMSASDYERNLPLYEKTFFFEDDGTCKNPLRLVIEEAKSTIQFAIIDGKWSSDRDKDITLKTKNEFKTFAEALADALDELIEAMEAAGSKVYKKLAGLLREQNTNIITELTKDKDALLPDATFTVKLVEGEFEN